MNGEGPRNQMKEQQAMNESLEGSGKMLDIKFSTVGAP